MKRPTIESSSISSRVGRVSSRGRKRSAPASNMSADPRTFRPADMAGCLEASNAELAQRLLPCRKLLERKLVDATCFVDGELAGLDGGGHLGLAPRDPAAGVGRWQVL